MNRTSAVATTVQTSLAVSSMSVTPFKTRKKTCVPVQDQQMVLLTVSLLPCPCFGCLRVEFRSGYRCPPRVAGMKTGVTGGVSGGNGQVTGSLSGHEKPGELLETVPPVPR